jgi:hypothetical protein
MQAWTKYKISAQERKKSLERKMLPNREERRSICSKCPLNTFILLFFRAYSEQIFVPRYTFSTITLKTFAYPRMR